jgi:hypothetical protein
MVDNVVFDTFTDLFHGKNWNRKIQEKWWKSMDNLFIHTFDAFNLQEISVEENYGMVFKKSEKVQKVAQCDGNL